MTRKITLIKTLLPLLYFLLLSLILYWVCLDGPFYVDDYSSILNRQDIRDIHSLITTFRQRYLGYFTFAINYSINGLRPEGYRLVNVIIHAINGFLVMLLAMRLWDLAGSSSSRGGTLMGFLAGSLFLIHPVQTQAVSYIAQRFTSMATMFYLLTLVLYLYYRTTISRRKWGFYAASFLSSICGMLSKEIAFTIPFMLYVLEVVFFQKGSRRRFFYLMPFFFILFLVPLQHISPGSGPSSILRATRVTAQGFTYSRKVYFLTEMSVILRYWRLLFWPSDLRFYYSWPAYNSLMEPSVILPALLHLGLLLSSAALVVAVSRGRVSKRYLLPTLGIIWFYLCLAVESSLIPLPDFIFEHRLYLPSIGPILAFSSIAIWLLRKPTLRYPVTGFLLVIMVFLSLTTYRRNLLWDNDILFWNDNIQKAMDHVGSYFQLAISYQQRGMHREAIREFTISANLRPDYYAIYELMGRSYEALGWSSDALSSYKKALQLNPSDAMAWALMGRLYLKEGQRDMAIEACRKALSIDPYDHEALRLNQTLHCLEHPR